MALDIPLPTAPPTDDPEQYTPLLLSAIEGFLLSPDVWAVEDYTDARQYMQQLMVYVVNLMEGDNVPRAIGEIIMFPTSSPPDKWLVCDGAAVSRTAYADLFTVLSTDYGAGDGTTTFNLPDFRDVSPMGIGTVVMGFGAVQGSLEVTLDIDEIPPHDHGFDDPGHFHRIGKSSGTAQAGVARPSANARTDDANAPHMVTDSKTAGISFGAEGDGQPHSNLHPVIGTSFLIYTGVV